MSVLWAWWQSTGVLVRSRAKRKQTQTLHGRVSPCREEVAVALSDQQDQPSWEAELCAHSSELLLLPSTAKTLRSWTCCEQDPGGMRSLLAWMKKGTYPRSLDAKGKLHWASPFDTKLGHTHELKAYLELHLKEEQERGGKADQKWPLFFLLTIYVLSDLNYNTFNLTLILCELLWSGWAIVSIKVSGSMIWIIS